MPTRVKISEFGIIQKGLANGVVTVYNMNADGSNSDTKASLYQAATGTAERSNPQTLDADGKLANDCWVEAEVVATITGINDTTERALKKVKQNPTDYALSATSANYNATNAIGSDTSAAASAATATTKAAEALASANNAATSETNAGTSETNASTSETNAAASAAAAASSAAEGLYRDVITLTNADSPYVPTAGQEGTLFRLDMTSGAITINLSTLATYAEDMKFGFVKVDGGGNSATINRGGSDTINGNTSVTLSTQYETHALIGDSGSSTWIDVIQSTGIASNAVDNTKLADMAQDTIKGRASGAGTGDPQDLTAAQATAILAAMVGDSGSGGTKGLVPAPASGDAAANKFLKADGTWAALSAGSLEYIGSFDGDGVNSVVISSDDMQDSYEALIGIVQVHRSSGVAAADIYVGPGNNSDSFSAANGVAEGIDTDSAGGVSTTGVTLINTITSGTGNQGSGFFIASWGNDLTSYQEVAVIAFGSQEGGGFYSSAGNWTMSELGSFRVGEGASNTSNFRGALYGIKKGA